MYIDIDGVLVVWDAGHNCIELSRGFGRLMRFCKIHDIQPCWLTMWALFPGTLDGVNCLLWPKTCPTLAHPLPVIYDRAKGKAASIDYDSDFVWIEDGFGPENMAELDRHGAADRAFFTDGCDPDCLIKFMDFTQEKLHLPPITDWGPAWDSGFTRPRRQTDVGIHPRNQIKP
jgi:hypothetical protein